VVAREPCSTNTDIHKIRTQKRLGKVNTENPLYSTVDRQRSCHQRITETSPKMIEKGIRKSLYSTVDRQRSCHQRITEDGHCSKLKRCRVTIVQSTVTRRVVQKRSGATSCPVTPPYPLVPFSISRRAQYRSSTRATSSSSGTPNCIANASTLSLSWVACANSLVQPRAFRR
jgi:hypothetical protein